MSARWDRGQAAKPSERDKLKAPALIRRGLSQVVFESLRKSDQIELIVQPAAKDAVGEMAVRGDWRQVDRNTVLLIEPPEPVASSVPRSM